MITENVLFNVDCGGFFPSFDSFHPSRFQFATSLYSLLCCCFNPILVQKNLIGKFQFFFLKYLQVHFNIEYMYLEHPTVKFRGKAI